MSMICSLSMISFTSNVSLNYPSKVETTPSPICNKILFSNSLTGFLRRLIGQPLFQIHLSLLWENQSLIIFLAMSSSKLPFLNASCSVLKLIGLHIPASWMWSSLHGINPSDMERIIMLPPDFVRNLKTSGMISPSGAKESHG